MSMKWLTENLSINKRFKAASIASLCAVLLLTSGCSLLPAEEEEEVLPTITPPKISQKPTYEVTTKTLETKVSGYGKLMSTREETLFFTEDNKRLKELYIQTGDKVQAGQLIAELDVSETQRELRTAKLQFRQKELAMIETLRKADEMEPSALEQAKIDFELERQKLVDMEESIERAKLKAPFSGTIVSVMVKKGATLKAYDPVSLVADLSNLAIAGNFTSEDLQNVAVGMEARVDINGLGEHKGKVKLLPVKTGQNPDNGGGIDGGGQQSDSIENYLIVQLDKVPPGLNRGNPLTITIITNRKENAVVIPTAALRSQGGRTYVQVMDDQGKREVDVEVGQQTATEVEILNGLQPGQKVVGR